MIPNKKSQLDFAVLIKGAIVMIVIIVVMFIIIKGFTIASDESIDKSDDYQDALDECSQGDSLCRDTFLGKIRGDGSKGETS